MKGFSLDFLSHAIVAPHSKFKETAFSLGISLPVYTYAGERVATTHNLYCGNVYDVRTFPTDTAWSLKVHTLY